MSHNTITKALCKHQGNAMAVLTQPLGYSSHTTIIIDATFQAGNSLWFNQESWYPIPGNICILIRWHMASGVPVILQLAGTKLPEVLQDTC